MSRLPLLSLLLALAAPAAAQTTLIEVNRLGDAVNVDPNSATCDIDLLDPGPQCTLRAAIQTANANAGHHTIVLQTGGIYQLNRVGDGGTEVGDLDVADDLAILGFIDTPPANSGDLPLIDAGGLNNRIFNVAEGVSLELRGLRLRGGNHPQTGGAIRSLGPLTIEWSLLDYNQAGTGGAVFVTGNDGALVLRDSHFEFNRALQNGAAVSNSGPSLIERSSFRDNRAQDLSGSVLELGEASMLIVNATIDGEAFGPPIAGLGNAVGIRSGGALDLALRNVTVSGFSQIALHLLEMETIHAPRLQVANSVLSSNVFSCQLEGADGDLPEVRFAYSLVQQQSGCGDYFQQVLTGVAPQLGALSPDPGRLTWSRPPSGLFANVVDAGIGPGVTPSSDELACTETDQRGNPRPQDGNGDESARCDMGAVEEGEPLTFLVDSVEDEVDDVSGDGLCETLSGICTLRAAVMEANALPGIQRIRFAAGLASIQLSLPAHPSAAGGDLDLSEGVIINGNRDAGGPATSIVQTLAGERLFDLPLAFDGPVILRHLRLSGGDSSAAFGGAIRQAGGQLQLQNSELFDNRTAFFGGAIAVHAGSLQLETSDLHGNSAEAGGGALFVGAGASASLTRSSIRDHSDSDPVSGLGLAAVYVEGNGTLRLINSTVAQNSAGVEVEQPLALVISHSTIVQNAGTGLLGSFNAGNQVSVRNSIIAGNGPDASLKGGPGLTDCLTPGIQLANVAAFEYVLDGDGSCPSGFGPVFTADPLLRPMQALAGQAGRAMLPHFDMAAGLVSPALDAAPAAGCLALDQAGAARPIDLPELSNVDGPCDLGAIEIQTEALFGNGFEE